MANNQETKDHVPTTNFKGFSNKDCEFFPCHEGVEGQFNCLFCYCPLAFLECPGPYEVFEDALGTKRKDCSACKLNHDGINRSWYFIQHWLKEPKPWSGKPQQTKRLSAAVPVLYPRNTGDP